MWCYFCYEIFCATDWNLEFAHFVDSMSSTLENKILNLQERLRVENESRQGDRQSNENTSCTGMQKSSVSITSPAPRRPRQRKFCLRTDTA